MNLVSLRIITDDVARLADFYERVTGVTAARQGEVFAELRTASGTLAIGSTVTVGPGAARPSDNNSVIIEFLVDDVDAEFVRLQDAVTDLVQQPTTMPWGNRSLLFRDPDGNLINLFTPVAPAAVEKFAHYER